MFLVMKLRKWDSLEADVSGIRIPISSRTIDSVGFCEVFKTRDAAVKEYGEDVVLVEIQPAGGE